MISNMVVIEAFLISLLIYTSIYVTATDLKKGIIQNKIIIIVSLLSLIANTIYYVFFAKIFILAYILNLSVMICISIAFYALHIWAAGDSKLLMLVISLIPARIYYAGNNVAATVIIMMLIFSIAYVYIISESIYLGIKEHNLFKIGAIKGDIKLMVKQYIKCTCLVTLFGFLIRFVLPQFYSNNIELIMIINMIIILLSFNFKFFDKVVPLICLVAITAVFQILFGGKVAISWRLYPVVLLVLILRFFAEKYNYQTIATSEVKEGMVLSYSTIVYFIPSSIKGLPSKTTEDIRSRLNGIETDSIKRWEKSKYGQPTITIVRKIPFAIFISIGTIAFVIGCLFK